MTTIKNQVLSPEEEELLFESVEHNMRKFCMPKS